VIPLQGIFINSSRPKSKKAIREAAANAPNTVQVEATSFFGNDFSGSITGMEIGQSITFVGPDPYVKRDFYGTIKRTATGFKVV